MKNLNLTFSRLLDPSKTAEGQDLSPGEQQAIARARFPVLVSKSHMRYWDPKLGIPMSGRRILIGFAASYSTPELRMADLIEDKLSRAALTLTVDVFNIDDLVSANTLVDYGFEYERLSSTPIVGVWQDSRMIKQAQGHQAIQLAFCELQLEHSSDVLFRRS